MSYDHSEQHCATTPDEDDPPYPSLADTTHAHDPPDNAQARIPQPEVESNDQGSCDNSVSRTGEPTKDEQAES